MSDAMIEVWKAEGRAEGLALGMTEAKRTDVLRALLLRFQGHPPPDITAAVREMTDLDLLARWFDAAVTAPSLEAFRHMVRG
jgi:hypothetical protein